jgi:hypothetical protein
MVNLPRRIDARLSPGVNGAAAGGLHPAGVDDELLRGTHGAIIGSQE